MSAVGKLIVVEHDKVEGTDKHKVTGTGPGPSSPTDPYIGIGDFDYRGKITDQLSDFIKIGGKPVAKKDSKSSLDPGEDTPPTGKHSGPMGSNFVPDSTSTAPTPKKSTLSITDPIGEGNPNAASGSSFVKIDDVKVLLDGDKIDTCDGMGTLGNSTVTAENQDFVSCSE